MFPSSFPKKNISKLWQFSFHVYFGWYSGGIMQYVNDLNIAGWGRGALYIFPPFLSVISFIDSEWWKNCKRHENNKKELVFKSRIGAAFSLILEFLWFWNWTNFCAFVDKSLQEEEVTAEYFLASTNNFPNFQYYLNIYKVSWIPCW